MRKITVRVLSVVMALITIASVSMTTGSAVSYSTDVDVKSQSALVVSLDSGQVVYEKDADSKRYPASTTKIMTYIVAVENIPDLEKTRVEVKKSIIDSLKNSESSMANLSEHVGKTVSVIDLLYSLMVPSGNDAALVLADYVGGGDINKFVEMMNEKAQALGCENTHFTNPDGLHDADHYTTARDLYVMSKYALTLPYFEKISNTTEYKCEGDDDDDILVTTNYLIDEARGGEYYYTYAKGIKTGTTDEAGRCLVTTASADGYSYMAVLLGAPLSAVKKEKDENGEEVVEEENEEYYTFIDAADLFRWALVNLEMQTIKSSQTPVCEQKVKNSWGRSSVSLVPEKNLNAIVPRDLKPNNIVVETDVPEVAAAPLSPDKPVGTASVYYAEDGKEKQLIAKVNLVPTEQVDKSALLEVLDIAGTIFRSYWFLIIIGIIVILLIVYAIYKKVHRNRQKRNRKVKRFRNL